MITIRAYPRHGYEVRLHLYDGTAKVLGTYENAPDAVAAINAAYGALLLAGMAVRVSRGFTEKLLRDMEALS